MGGKLYIPRCVFLVKLKLYFVLDIFEINNSTNAFIIMPMEKAGMELFLFSPVYLTDSIFSLNYVVSVIIVVVVKVKQTNKYNYINTRKNV